MPALAAPRRKRVKLRPLPVYPKQRDFIYSDQWLSGFCGGRGTGKTYSGAVTIHEEAENGEPWMCVSPDAGVVSQTTLPTFIEVSKKAGKYIRHTLSPYPIVHFHTKDGGKAEIVFRSAEVPGKLRGPSKAGLWFDEATVMSQEAYDFGVATLRWRGKMGRCLLTFTPKGRAHWTFSLFYTPANDVEQSMTGKNGFDPETGIHWIMGRPYRAKKNSRLIRAHTLDNPFLPDIYFENIAANYSTTLRQQELGGEFVDIAGIMFQREHFLMVEKAPRVATRVRYWDRASSPGSGKYSAGVLIARDDRGLFYIEDVVRGQWSYHDRNEIMMQTAEMDRMKYAGEVITYTEQEGGSSGKEVGQQIVTMLAGHPVYVDVVGGKKSRKVDGVELPGEAKVIRASGIAAQVEAGNVRIVRAGWNADYLDEMTAFPEYTYSDQVDATSGAANKLTGASINASDTPTKGRASVGSERFGALAVLEKIKQRRLRG